MTSNVRFTIPAKREFAGLVRLAIGGLAAAMPFDDDTIDDIKLVMSEVSTNIILGAAKQTNVSDMVFLVSLSPSDITIDIDSSPAVEELVSLTSDWENPKRSGYGLSIISTLMDRVELVPGEDENTVLRLIKFT